MKEKRTTIRKKMSMRDYITLAYFFKTGERQLDLSDYDPNYLALSDIRVMRLTAEEKSKMDEFFKECPLGISFEALLASVPKIKKPAQLTATKNDEQVEPVRLNPAVKVDDFDFVDMVVRIENNELTKDEAIKSLGGTDNDRAREILITSTPQEIKDMNKRYSQCNEYYEVLMEADRKRLDIIDIMSEMPRTEEENKEIYKRYFINRHVSPINVALDDAILIFDKIDTIKDNMIIFDKDNVFEYDSEADMIADVLYLAGVNKLDHDISINIFGKTTSINKIIDKLSKKYPEGYPDGDRLWLSRKEAYLAGALVL